MPQRQFLDPSKSNFEYGTSANDPVYIIFLALSLIAALLLFYFKKKNQKNR